MSTIDSTGQTGKQEDLRQMFGSFVSYRSAGIGGSFSLDGKSAAVFYGSTNMQEDKHIGYYEYDFNPDASSVLPSVLKKFGASSFIESDRMMNEEFRASAKTKDGKRLALVAGRKNMFGVTLGRLVRLYKVM